MPVGDDQRQHVEITRDIALRFNHRFGETFVVPEAVTPQAGARVMDLQNPTAKMSKSAETGAGMIQMLDDPDMIRRKFKRAVTDSENEVRYDPVAKPGVSNLLEILGAATDQDPDELAKGYTQYGPLKSDAGDAVVELLTPIQDRYRELLADPGELAALLRTGADKARAVASATLQRAYDAIGFLAEPWWPDRRLFAEAANAGRLTRFGSAADAVSRVNAPIGGSSRWRCRRWGAWRSSRCTCSSTRRSSGGSARPSSAGWRSPPPCSASSSPAATS